jgi:hypothetical protein
MDLDTVRQTRRQRTSGLEDIPRISRIFGSLHGINEIFTASVFSKFEV